MSFVLGLFLTLAALAALAQQSIITPGAEQLPDAPSSVINQKASNERATSLSNPSNRFLNLAAPNSATVSALIFTGGSRHATTAAGPDPQSEQLSAAPWKCASSSAEKAEGKGWFNSLVNLGLKNQHYCALHEGGIWKRGTYAMSQAFTAHKYDGVNLFTASQFSGAVPSFASGYAAYPAYANQYDAGQRMAARYATAVGRDTLKNLLREFWPDISTHVVKRQPIAPPTSPR